MGGCEGMAVPLSLLAWRGDRIVSLTPSRTVNCERQPPVPPSIFLNVDATQTLWHVQVGLLMPHWEEDFGMTRARASGVMATLHAVHGFSTPLGGRECRPLPPAPNKYCMLLL